MIDLHTHTTASDGRCSPRELVQAAAARGLRVLAVTDHDSVTGIAEAAREGAKLGVEIVPGVELSAKWDSGILHILGYYIRTQDPLVQRCLDAFRGERPDLFAIFLAALEESRSSRGNTAPATSKAGAEKPHVPLIYSESSPYSPKANVSPDQAIRFVLAAGGTPVLAHPYTLILYSHEDWDTIITKLAALGIQGIEAYYPAHTSAQTAMFVRSARELGLLVTGGSDFHGNLGGSRGRLGCIVEQAGIPGHPLTYSLIEALKRRAEGNRRRAQANAPPK